jgi:DNA replication protein DnaD
MSSFSFINPKNQLWKDSKIAKTQQKILDTITSYPHDIRKDKFNMELLTMICCMIEHSINNTEKKDKLKIDKKALCIQIYNSLFGQISPTDIETISKNIEYLHDNNQIIKYSVFVVVSKSIYGWLKKKVL